MIKQEFTQKVILEKRTKHPHTSTFEMQNIVRGIHKGQIKVAAFGEAQTITRKHLSDYHGPATLMQDLINESSK